MSRAKTTALRHAHRVERATESLQGKGARVNMSDLAGKRLYAEDVLSEIQKLQDAFALVARRPDYELVLIPKAEVAAPESDEQASELAPDQGLRQMLVAAIPLLDCFRGMEVEDHHAVQDVCDRLACSRETAIDLLKAALAAYPGFRIIPTVQNALSA